MTENTRAHVDKVVGEVFHQLVDVEGTYIADGLIKAAMLTCMVSGGLSHDEAKAYLHEAVDKFAFRKGAIN